MKTGRAATAVASPAQLARLAAALPALVLTGAGISAGAGIPTYRDCEGKWLRSDPITHQEFVADASQRQRYWGRSLLGWPAVRDARPGIAHRLLVTLQARGHLTRVVTQNVDRLHQRAGSADVIDLHGRLDRVRCLACEHDSCREHIQSRLLRLNPQISAEAARARPDGDADLPDSAVECVRVPECERCGGMLMPDVVFFGGRIPGQRVRDSKLALERSRSLLIIGSSLQVYSGYRFCRWAEELDKPLFIINPGRTRADDRVCEKISAPAEESLQQLLTLLDATDLPAAQQSGPATTDHGVRDY